MKNLLIIYPHWPPSNLAGVHRPRLIANQLKSFDWVPIILTVDPVYYEETLDEDLLLTVNEGIEVIHTKAVKITKHRLVGDIGLRAFIHLYKRALKIIKLERIDFIWIPIPSFYCALLGRLVHRKTKVPYGIDYIDPWVRDISTRLDWRHRLSNWVAKILEPIALKKASLITGVSYEYYRPAIERNFQKRQISALHERTIQQFNNSAVQPVCHIAFPYGFDPGDQKIKLDDIQYPWSDEEDTKPWIYAGAFLPNSRIFVELLFRVIEEIRRSGMWDENVRLYFIGTGTYPGTSIREYAEEVGINDMVIEDRNRYPYLHILNYLSKADTVMVIGSTEKHYTASKVYQALLSEKPVWAVFHEDSSAVQVMKECKADQFLVEYQEGMAEGEMKVSIKESIMNRLKTDTWNPDLKALDKYSAKESTRKLAEGIEYVLRDPEILKQVQHR